MEVHATGWNQRNLRQGGFERLDVAGPAHCATGKNLYEISAGFPSGDHFGGGKSPSQNEHSLIVGKLNSFLLETGRHHNGSACLQPPLGGIRIETGTRATDNFTPHGLI